jgi:DNA repair exonuclease SbcCD nuclease subunit
MRKFIYFTDLHYGARPVNRKDDYNKSILGKLERVFQLAYKNECVLLYGGDLFDSPKIGFLAFNPLINLLNSYIERGLKLHVVMGNEGHDGHPEQSPLELLNSVGVVEIIRTYKEFGDVRVIGAGHGTDPVISSNEYSSKSHTNILLTHHTLTKSPVIFEHYLWEDFKVPVEIVCVAHYHPYQGIEDVSGIKFIAPGALSRRKKTKHDIDRIPKCVYIQVENGIIKTKELDIKCEKDVWSNNLRLEIEESIADNTTVKDEITNMKNLIDEQVSFTNINDALRSFAKRINHTDETVNYILKAFGGM